jgi:hypothetical protein
MTSAADYAAHKEEYSIRNAAYYATHREKIAARQVTYRAANREKIADHMAAYRVAHLKEKRELHRQRRMEALSKIAARWNRPVECMIDLTPHAKTWDVFLSTIPHAGPMEIDHLNGGGRHEGLGGAGIIYAVLSGRRSLNDLRILCALHNRLSWMSPTHGFEKSH